MTSPLLRNIDCHSLPVGDLDAAIDFYETLGHQLIWWDETAAGLRLPESKAELVLHTDGRPIETDFKVASVPEAITRFVDAGGSLAHGPFEIGIGLCAVLLDPWDNPVIVLDASKGLVEVDEHKNVVDNGDA